MDISFQKVNQEFKEIVFSWLAEPHVQEFWDNTPEHKEDILNFIDGRKTPSTYGDGRYVYWLAKYGDVPFALLMTIQETMDEDINQIKLDHLSKTGHTYCIDYMIGNKEYVGKGLGARTLSEFMLFFKDHVDPKMDTIIIDPAADNPRAKHVYEKAGFEHVGDFTMVGNVSGKGQPHHLLVKRF